MFLKDFKYYKSRNPAPSFENVLDFSNSSINKNASVKKYELTERESNNFFGLKPHHDWKIYELAENPGFIFIVNPFTLPGHRYWIARSLNDLSRKPHKSNIDNQNLLTPNEDWWTVCSKNEDIQRSELVRKKMRWVTLGYHHNWDTKVYSEIDKHPFPEDLNKLCKYIASLLRFSEFEAQAAILNFYSPGDTLSGHTDHSEPFKEAPLISISFGQPAIFLIGGETKDTKPTAVYLKSGDVTILSGRSRLSYHAVPKILETSEKLWNENLCNDNFENILNSDVNSDIIEKINNESNWKPFDDYLQHFRINLNVRQVLPKNKACLD